MDKKIISEDRKKYLRKNFWKKNTILFSQIMLVVLFLTFWEVLANKGIIDSFIMSQPSRIWQTFIDLASEDLWKHVGITCFETIVGFTSGTIIGIIIAIILWWSNFLSKVAEPFLVILNSLPKVALRTSYHYLGRCWHASYYCDGAFYFFDCHHFGKFKWFFKN